MNPALLLLLRSLLLLLLIPVSLGVSILVACWLMPLPSAQKPRPATHSKGRL